MPSASRSGSSISAIDTRRKPTLRYHGAVARPIRIVASVTRLFAGSNSKRSRS